MTLIPPEACTTLLPMNAITFKQRLTSAKRRIREMKAAGQPVELTRSWSVKSLKELSKALEGGPSARKSTVTRRRVSVR
jgi:hypothetical protein